MDPLALDVKDRQIVAATRFAPRVTDYYARLIDPADPHDPIRRLVAPGAGEMLEFGSADASNEASNTVLSGLQHKYSDTALLLVSDECAGYCRYCFHKRIFTDGQRETILDFTPALDYIESRTEITDVLLSGGDPLMLPTDRLSDLIERLLTMPHVRTIRVGSKVPAFMPSRITGDPALLEVLERVAVSGRTMHVMTHFDHPRELTNEAREALIGLRAAGATCLNQCPITRGVNDDASVLADLFQSCTEAGTPQYYVFQCRPARGNATFVVPIVRAMQLIEAARDRVSGISRRARFCMSAESGKIEILGLSDAHIFARYHRAKHRGDAGRMMVFRRNEGARWLDDLVPMTL